jgi:hypothetical protein
MLERYLDMKESVDETLRVLRDDGKTLIDVDIDEWNLMDDVCVLFKSLEEAT